MNVRHRGIKLLGHCAFAGLAPTFDVGLNFSVRLRWRSGGVLLEMDDDFLLILLVHLRAAVALFPHYLVIFLVLERPGLLPGVRLNVLPLLSPIST